MLILWIRKLLHSDLVNSHIVYQQLNANLNLFDVKLVTANSLIGKYSNRQRVFHQSQPTRRKSASEVGPANTLAYCPEYQVSRQRCMYCKTDDKDIKLLFYVKFTVCTYV